jgi:CDP-glycerol glycerophosphotransferase (TagB/SpsB family)
MVQYYELSLTLLEKENPDFVLMENEYVGFERALIYACHKKRIPSLAQQHGVITEDHIGYLYSKEDISPQDFSNFPYCPLATSTAVIGPIFKDILTEISAYPESKVVISGQPRYDIFFFADRIYDKEDFFKRHNLDPKKKLVLLATQPFHIEMLRQEFLENILKNTNSIDGIQLVIKPHPNETINWFNQKLASVKTDVMVLPPKSDTIEAIFACDAFISVNSTTILEALILDKPVVVVNLSNQIEPLPWVKEGAALGVYTADKIQSTIEAVLFEENVKKQLHKKCTDFVFKYLYKIDGKATDRVISLIQELVK